MGSALSTLAAAPCTCALAAFMTALFAYMWNHRIGLEAVCLTYNRVARERQHYRLLTAALTHVDAMHILFNMGSLLNLAPLEGLMGSAWYAETTLLLLYASMAGWMLAVHVAATRYGLTAWAEAPVVGYSGVIFGWMTLAGMLQPTGEVFGLPITLAPFLSLALTQLIVPRASFLGHLAGIVAGYATGWGLLEGVRGYWLCVGTAAAAGACLLSLRSTPLGPAVARCMALSPALLAALEGGSGGAGEGGAVGAGGRARIVGGVLTQWRGVGRAELAATAATAQPQAQAQAQAQAHQGLPVAAALVGVAAAAAPPAPAAGAGGAGGAAGAGGGAAGAPAAAAPGQQLLAQGAAPAAAAAAANSSARSNGDVNDPAAALLSRHV